MINSDIGFNVITGFIDFICLSNMILFACIYEHNMLLLLVIQDLKWFFIMHEMIVALMCIIILLANTKVSFC